MTWFRSISIVMIFLIASSAVAQMEPPVQKAEHDCCPEMADGMTDMPATATAAEDEASVACDGCGYAGCCGYTLSPALFVSAPETIQQAITTDHLLPRKTVANPRGNDTVIPPPR